MQDKNITVCRIFGYFSGGWVDEDMKEIRWTGRKKKSTEFLSKSVLFLSFVAEKDAPGKALRPNGFEVLRNLYFCFSALFSNHFRTPY